MSTNKTPARTFDWSLAPRGVVSATALATSGLVAVGGAGDIAHINPVFAGLGAGVGALSHLIATTAQGKHAPGAIIYRLACWTGAGSWLTWAMSGPDHWYNGQGLAALAIGAVGAGVAAGPIGGQRRTNTPRDRRRRGGELVPAAGPVALAWEARFKRVCRVPVRVLAVTAWANGAGFDLHCQLPPGNITRDRIAAAADALATDARLPEGCGVEARPVPGGKGNRGEFVLAVSTHNRLGSADDPEPVKIHYPADYSPRSILAPVGLGEHRDGSVAGVQLREQAALIVGQTGGGKTNLLDVTTLGIARCKDALVWHIDMNGGGMSQFWLAPWLNGQTDRPVIDWAAPNPVEALYMTTLALAIAKDRKTSYREFKAAANAKLLPVSEGLPEIVLMIDEGAEVLAPTNRDPISRQVRDNLEEIQRIGRNEAVRPVISSLRPTQDMIAPNILKQSAIKMALYGLDAADLGHLYSWRRGISMDDLPSQGCAFLGAGTNAPRPMKAWFLEPAQIREAAVAIAAYRPELDDASAEVANGEHVFRLGGKVVKLTDVYANRYARMRAAFTGQAPDEAQQEPTAPTRPTTTTAPQRPAPFRLLQGGAAPAGGSSAKDWPDPFDRQPKPAQTTRAVRSKDWPDPLPGRPLSSATAPAGVLTAPRPAALAQPVPELVRRALAAFDAADDDRMHSEALAGELGVTPHDLAEMLRPLGVRSLPSPFSRGGVSKRGYAREHFTAAADAITRGSLQVPADVAAWPTR